MDFSAEDRIDSAAFNQIVWSGLKGNNPYPLVRGCEKERRESKEGQEITAGSAHERKRKLGT